MIINIRGTHGSGKSTIVRSIIDSYPYISIPGLKDKLDGYKILIPWLTEPVYVVGSYETPCGGCDGIQPYSLIWPRVVDYANQGHVVFEGALVSSSYGNIGRDSEAYGDEFVFAFLNTPLSVCLERIKARRVAKGNLKPVDPKNTTVKYNNILKGMPKLTQELHRKVVTLNYLTPVPQLLGMLLQSERGNNARTKTTTVERV